MVGVVGVSRHLVNDKLNMNINDYYRIRYLLVNIYDHPDTGVGKGKTMLGGRGSRLTICLNCINNRTSHVARCESARARYCYDCDTKPRLFLDKRLP